MINTISPSPSENRSDLPEIPLFRSSSAFPEATLEAFSNEAHALIDGATQGVPARALKYADQISRRWLVKSNNTHLAEIDAIAEQLDRPGAYYLSVNYEWGCTVAVRPVQDHAELIRVLDWRTPGLGRYLIAANVQGASGDYLTLTWPGYTGVLQAMAPNRFAAAINQAPMPRRGGGFMPLDWFANKVEVWRSKDITPAHLLRDVFERAKTFAEARRRLAETPIASPAIFSLVGCRPNELSIIERSDHATHIHDGTRATANTWQTPAWKGRPRGSNNLGRIQQLSGLPNGPTIDFAWLRPPVLNPTTRLAAVFTPATCALLAQGFANEKPATQLFNLSNDGLTKNPQFARV